MVLRVELGQVLGLLNERVERADFEAGNGEAVDVLAGIERERLAVPLFKLGLGVAAAGRSAGGDGHEVEDFFGHGRRKKSGCCAMGEGGVRGVERFGLGEGKKREAAKSSVCL